MHLCELQTRTDPSQGIVTGVMGVIFFVYNAIFSTVLLVMVLVASFFAITSKNPETRYQPMRDDRGSFIKSQSQLTTELDALGATARGESKHGYTTKSGARIEDDDDSWSGGSTKEKRTSQAGGYANSNRGYYEPPRSPINPSATGFPSAPSQNSSSRHLPPGGNPSRGDTISPYGRADSTYSGSQGRFRGSEQQQQQYGSRGSPSPWQRGAGYD